MAKQPANRAVLLVGVPLFWSAIYVYNSYLSVYARSLGASLSFVGVIVATYGLAQLVLRIPVGIASDRIGRRKPFVLAGTVAAAASCAAMLIAQQPWVLVLGRALAGIAAACWVALSVLLVMSYPGDQVVRATSMAAALSGTGTTLASALGGQIAQVAGTTAPFWVGIGLGLLTLALLTQVREPERPEGKPASLGALIGVGRVPLVLAVSILAMLAQYSSWAMTFSFVPIYAADLGATKAQLGWLMSAWQGCSALVAFSAGHISARLGTRWPVALGLLLAAISILVVPLTRSMGLLIMLRALHGIGQGASYPVLMAGALLAVPEERRGAAMGFFQAIYAVGMVAGPAVSGVLADRLGLGTTFGITGLVSLVTALAAVVVLPLRITHVRQA